HEPVHDVLGNEPDDHRCHRIVIARSPEGATKQSKAECAALNCFAEPVIGRATSGRTRWLAMTDSTHCLGRRQRYFRPGSLRLPLAYSPSAHSTNLPSCTTKSVITGTVFWPWSSNVTLPTIESRSLTLPRSAMTFLRSGPTFSIESRIMFMAA